MRRFTIIFSVLLVLGFAGTLGYVGMSPDFVDPAEAAQTGGSIDRTAPVWNMTLDDLAAYLADAGVINPEDFVKINYNSALTGRVGYRFSNQIDIEHYDFDNLDEASREEYDGLAATGSMVYVNGQVGYFWINGPFVLHFYEWGKDPLPEEDQPAIIDLFYAFGEE